jgi:osmotically-inducible protein OsmY
MKTKSMSSVVAACVLVASPVLISSCASAPTQESTGEYIDDAVITTKVKSALLKHEEVSGLDVGVETFKGRVQLSGFVETQREKTKAEELARGVAGVKSVSNNLIVKAN